MNKKKLLAIIPARKGSQGVKNKNIREILGKKLIDYSLESSLKSDCITKIVVSTDSEEIMETSKKFGISVNDKRPAHLCTSEALTVDVLLYEIKKLIDKKEFYEYIVLLQPTCPLRSASDIDEAYDLMTNNLCDSLISVVDVDGQHPLRMKSIRNNYLYNYIETGLEDMRPRQKLPKVYIRNGAIYMAKMEYFLSNQGFGSNKCLAYEMPEERSINIDSEKDFLVAEYYIKKFTK